MSIVQVDNGHFIVGVPIEVDRTISIDRFNRMFPTATMFLFKRHRSNIWHEYVNEYILKVFLVSNDLETNETME